MSDLEVYIVPGKPVYEPGEHVKLYVLASSSRAHVLHVEVVGHRGVIAEASLDLKANSEAVLELPEVTAPRIPGKYELELRINSKVVDRARYIVLSEQDSLVERRLAFVWHHHQAPNYLPDGTYYYSWAFTHVYNDELAPYGKGPYHYHALMLEKYRDYRCTYNLSPSLLHQWEDAIENGIKLRDRYIPRDSPEVELIKETLELYRKAVHSSQVEVLTSMYAHSIAGYLVEYLGAEDIVKEEVEYGIEVTRRIIGVEPRGVWTPEMAFTMKLVDVYSDLGLEYTVLDAKCHLEKSKGDVSGHLEPYLVRGGRGELVVFFRDTELSNHVSFKNNFKSSIHAWKSAYNFVYEVTSRLHTGGTLTIALDGENWMIFSKKPPLTAVFYDRMLNILHSLQEAGYLRTVTLREVLSEVEPKRVLKWVPTTTWLCGFSKWHGEVKEHDLYWARAKRVYEAIRSYEEKHGRNEDSRKARWALWHALDSDYWWAEFWEPTLINTWLNKAEKHLADTTRVQNTTD
ncbi:MAG: glycoside hydrolase family 57 protein [Desulfurococcaceae archaeon]